MPEEDIKTGDKKSGGQETDWEAEAKKKDEQIANLNKGIASTREELKLSKETNATLQEKIDSAKKETTPTDDVDLDPTDKKKLDAWASKHGFVTQEALNAEKANIRQESLKSIANQATNEFLKANPSYDTDENWSKIETEFQRYRTPTTIDGFRDLFQEIKVKLEGGKEAEKKAGDKVRAEIANNGRLSLGGKSQGGSDNESETEALTKKYPNLSKEQILARQRELQELYPKKEEK